MKFINQVFFVTAAILQAVWGFEALEKLICHIFGSHWTLENYCKDLNSFTMPLYTLFALVLPISLLNPYFLLLLDIAPIWTSYTIPRYDQTIYVVLLTLFKAFGIFLISRKHYQIIYYNGFHSPLFAESAEVPTYTQLFTLYGNSRIESERNRIEYSTEDESTTKERLNNLAEYLRQEFAMRVLFNEFKKLPVRIQIN